MEALHRTGSSGDGGPPAVPEEPAAPGPRSGSGVLRRRPIPYRRGMDFVPNGIFICPDVPLMASAPGAAPERPWAARRAEGGPWREADSGEADREAPARRAGADGM